MLDLDQLGFGCPVNWKQSSFMGLGLMISNNDHQVHIHDYMFNKDVLLMIIAQTANPRWPEPIHNHIINLFNSYVTSENGLLKSLDLYSKLANPLT